MARRSKTCRRAHGRAGARGDPATPETGKINRWSAGRGFGEGQGRWYGWPDFIGGVPVVNARFRPQRGPAPQFLLANHSDLPPPEQPLLAFPPHSAAVKFDVAPQSSESWAGCIAVALFGDERPMTAPYCSQVGGGIARIATSNWTLQPVECGTFKRPIDVRFHPSGDSLYVLDFGEFELGPAGELAARAGTGTLSRVEIGA